MNFSSDQDRGVTLINKNLQLYGLPTIDDGNSFLHAVSGCALEEYQQLTWDKYGHVITKNIEKVSKNIADLRKNLISVLNENNYMNSSNTKKYLENLFSNPEYLNNKNGRERLINRIFDVYNVLGTERRNSAGIISGWNPPIGVRDGYFYRTETLKYKLVDFDGEFNPLKNLSIEDQSSLFLEFKNLSIDDPKNIYIPDIALKQYYYHANEVYRPSTAGVFNLGMNGNLCVWISSQVNFKQFVKFFLEEEATNFTEWSMRVTMYALDLNLIVMENKTRTKYECCSPSRPWIIVTLENNKFYTTGIEKHGNLITIFSQDDPIIQTLIDTTDVDILLNIETFKLKKLISSVIE